MTYPSLRQFKLPWLDAQVSRTSMQICNHTIIQQLYISRISREKQFLVVSNPTEQTMNLTGYTITDIHEKNIYTFPENYILLAGDEVTLWCAPHDMDLNTDNLLHPYLFWTNANNTLRKIPFFHINVPGDEIVILRDHLHIEIASYYESADGKTRDIHVLQNKSSCPPKGRYLYGTNKSICLGCLATVQYTKTIRQKTALDDSTYIFSRYWDIISEKNWILHSVGIIGVSICECIRSICILWCFTVFTVGRKDLSVHDLFWSIFRVFMTITSCDIISRSFMMCMKSGFFVSLASIVGFILDQMTFVIEYSALGIMYPSFKGLFRNILIFQLTINFLHLVGTANGFIMLRNTWHPFYQELVRWEYYWQTYIGFISLGHELCRRYLILYPLLQSMYSTTQVMRSLTFIGYASTPFYTIGLIVQLLHGLAVLHYFLYLAIGQERYQTIKIK